MKLIPLMSLLTSLYTHALDIHDPSQVLAQMPITTVEFTQAFDCRSSRRFFRDTVSIETTSCGTLGCAMRYHPADDTNTRFGLEVLNCQGDRRAVVSQDGVRFVVPEAYFQSSGNHWVTAFLLQLNNFTNAVDRIELTGWQIADAELVERGQVRPLRLIQLSGFLYPSQWDFRYGFDLYYSPEHTGLDRIYLFRFFDEVIIPGGQITYHTFLRRRGLYGNF